ncbi:MAG: glycosyltransferase family 2 protein [Paracoccus sp. (in: a-proteobacteria)]|nr:glycosyltransferase family 2 protein [Paracoccus sp. (in: a-proteobacteria)]
MSPKLSILIPTYNVEAYVIECLQSIDAQMTDACEIIVYDDCSSDSTVQRVTEFLGQSRGHIRLEAGTENRGVSFSRNRLLDLAAGEYVWFIDSDDTICPTAVATIMHALATGADAVSFGFHRWVDGSAPSGPVCLSFSGPAGFIQTTPDGFYAATLSSGNMHPWNRVFRRRLFSSDLRFPEGRIYEDLEIIPLVMSRAQSAVFIDQPLVAYRQRPDSLLNTAPASQEVDTLVALRQQRSRYEQMYGPMPPRAVSAFITSCASHMGGLVKNTLKTLPRDEQKAVFRKALEIFDEAVRMSDRKVFMTLRQEKRPLASLHLWKRLRQARMKSR